jgi:hypothetical protein
MEHRLNLDRERRQGEGNALPSLLCGGMAGCGMYLFRTRLRKNRLAEICISYAVTFVH